MSLQASELTRDQLLSALRRDGVVVTSSQLRRWTDAGLLSAPRRQGLGRGRGTVSFYPLIALWQIAALKNALKQSRSLDDAGWGMWVLGFDVTPFVRELLAFEWREAATRAKAVTRALTKKRTRETVTTRAKAGQLGIASSILRVLKPDSVPGVLQMLAELEGGTLHERPHSDDEYERLQDASIAMLWPDEPALLDDDDLPSIPEVRAGLARQSRELSPTRLVKALKETDDRRLLIVRNEAQAIFSMIARSLGHEDAILPRNHFRQYFARRVVDAEGKDEGQRLRQMMGWHRPPLSPLQEWYAERLAHSTKGQHADT